MVMKGQEIFKFRQLQNVNTPGNVSLKGKDMVNFLVQQKLQFIIRNTSSTSKGGQNLQLQSIFDIMQ